MYEFFKYLCKKQKYESLILKKKVKKLMIFFYKVSCRVWAILKRVVCLTIYYLHMRVRNHEEQ